MAENLILKGLQQNAKALAESNRIQVADNFDAKIVSFIPDKFYVYFVDEFDQETGTTITRTEIPKRDESGQLIEPEGARKVPTVRVVLQPVDLERKPFGTKVIGFVLADNVRYLPEGINPVGLLVQATGVKRVIQYGENKGEDGFYISGIDVLAENKVVQLLAAASRGGAFYSSRND